LARDEAVKTAADAILFQLKSLGEAQAETLARRLCITVQAVRQRLERLCDQKLVSFTDQARGRGRPRRIWYLTPDTASLFPDTHAQLTVDLIGSIRSTLGEAAFARILRRRTAEITAAYAKRLSRERTIARKLQQLSEIRSSEGYMARVEKLSEEGYLFIEDHCPICAAAVACQGFCAIELEVFQKLFGVEWRIERDDHLLSGARRCTYRITRAAADNPTRQRGKRGHDDPLAPHL
jgi:predicted ArsR family transcriptional regulator